jgi:putative lipoic acid-binding regulatory protein
MVDSCDNPPKIEFPCHYHIKVIGDACDRFEPDIMTVLRKHDPGLDVERIRLKSSGKGNFVSMSVTLWATGTDQLSALDRDLKATGVVRMVL